MRAVEALRELTASLLRGGLPEARKEAEMILRSCLEITPDVLYRDNPPLSPDQKARLDETLRRRLDREPLQYITGKVEFCGLDLEVGPGVLIPRPETELLVEEVLKTLPRAVTRATAASPYRTKDEAGRRLAILDLCTGSGCIALALARAVPNVHVIGTDISAAALAYARVNAERNGIDNVEFREGSLFEPVAGSLFDVIVANPPYVVASEIEELQPEVARWEPRLALDGGEDGLDFYREIITRAGVFLDQGGLLFFELGYGESADVAALAEAGGYGLRAVVKDFAGIERILSLFRRPSFSVHSFGL